ncbi:unnamed protein product [Closterium sp. NIES-64]|nr:unnamed protein product [Closterium sp. NIES-64]
MDCERREAAATRASQASELHEQRIEWRAASSFDGAGGRVVFSLPAPLRILVPPCSSTNSCSLFSVYACYSDTLENWAQHAQAVGPGGHFIVFAVDQTALAFPTSRYRAGASC